MNKADKARIYNRMKRRLSYAEFALTVLYLAALLATGWTFGLRNAAVSLGGGPAVWLASYFLAGFLMLQALTLPVAIMSGYHLEKAFGLLNQTPRAWAGDYLKSQLVGFVLGLLSVELLYLFLRMAGQWWWLWAGAAFSAFFVVLAQLTPVVILPLFFKFKRLPDDEFTARLLSLCRKAGAEVPGIYEWGLSTRTNRANAALVGRGRTRRVVLSDTLLKDFNPSEVEVVLAHELGHFRLGHLTRLLIVQSASAFLAFALADGVLRAAGGRLGLAFQGDVAGLPLLMLIFVSLGAAAMPLLNWYSRRLERQADNFALELTGLSGSFISTMERLAILNMAEFDPHPLVEFLFHAHPSPSRRIAAAKRFSAGKTGQAA